MEVGLKVTCNKGLTGVAAGQDIVLSDLRELRRPSGWAEWDLAGPGRGRVRFDGRTDWFHFRTNLIWTGAHPILQCTLFVPGREAASALAPAMMPDEWCFSDSGTGDHVVGTWVAEGGG